MGMPKTRNKQSMIGLILGILVTTGLSAGCEKKIQRCCVNGRGGATTCPTGTDCGMLAGANCDANYLACSCTLSGGLGCICAGITN